ncbi:TPA_asm: hypothetical protein GEA28_01665 [Campylobacter coli]|uniref:hypothetical protein n=1 Tax=Campylobacter coli TaxID=195 RepID=UPI000874C84B|nr:hypothetical protein [Campylobacter coli]OEV78932.1 hypothetical protein AJO35_07110 [Campylobacter coli]OEV80306.1 hypothetical protein AJ467_09160 [Campylobacter coli]OEV82275.1 hypothetical protein AJO33_09085 [Campylobacter coli]OEW85367.1 hypothetical protein A0L90_03650 [Campylobacter coli]OEW91147.1 hypothetical protein A0M31_08845 [Campylobacter coli]
MLDYNSWQEAQAKVEPLRKQVMEAILKDKRFNATIEDRNNLLKVEIKNTIFDLIFDLGNFHIEASFNLFSLGFLEHSSNVIIFQGDYDLYKGNVKRIVDDLYFELSREIPNTRRALKDLIKDCKRVLKLKVNDK